MILFFQKLSFEQATCLALVSTILQAQLSLNFGEFFLVTQLSPNCRASC